jgi:HlyD family secretion protein
VRKKRLFFYAGGGLLIVVAIAVLLLRQGTRKAESAPLGQVTRTAVIARGDLDLTVSANGVVQPIKKVEIKSKASGQILQLNFEEGQQVTRGELLIALDQTTTRNDYDQAKADLALAEATVTQQRNNDKRSGDLFTKGLISQQERDQSTVDFVRAQSQLVKARATLSSADERLRETRIVAPSTGIILSKSVDLGQIIASGVSNVGGGTVLATVADMTEVYVETNVDEVDIGKVRVGHRARVVADAFPDETFQGEVVRIAPLGKTLQNVTTFNVIILVRNVNNRLKAGMSAAVDIEIFRRQNVLLVPNEALKDPRSEQGRELLAAMAAKDTLHAADSARGTSPGGTEDFRAMRERMQSLPPEERAKLREQFQQRLQAMSPEERERFASMRRERRGPEGDGRPGMTGAGAPGSRTLPRRSAQVSPNDSTRERIVLVRENGVAVPRKVVIGVANFDNAEVLSGLREGDEIQMTSLSRAKIAQEQWNDRMRSMQALGGTPGGGGGRR